MSALPSWGHELEAYRRRQRRREAVRAVLGALAAILGAIAVLVVAYLATIYVLTLPT